MRADRQTDRHTDTLIVTLRTPTGREVIIIIIIFTIAVPMFMVRSPWHSHCERSPGLFDTGLSATSLPTSSPTNGLVL